MEGTGGLQKRGMAGSSSVEWGVAPGELQSRVVSLGRNLLQRFEASFHETPAGLPTMVLPAGGFGLLVLGIPIPVFSYMGDENQILQRRVVERLRETAGTMLCREHRVELHSFSHCFGAVPERKLLDLLPFFGRLNGRRKATFLGVQLVTVLPLSEAEVSMWPRGPAGLRECADRFLEALPKVYWELDQDLILIHQSKTGGIGGELPSEAASPENI